MRLHGGVVGVTDFAAFLDVHVVRRGSGGRVSLPTKPNSLASFCLLSNGVIKPTRAHPLMYSSTTISTQLVRCNAMLHPHDVPEGFKLLRDNHPLPLESDPHVIRRGMHVQVGGRRRRMHMRRAVVGLVRSDSVYNMRRDGGVKGDTRLSLISFSFSASHFYN